MEKVKFSPKEILYTISEEFCYVDPARKIMRVPIYDEEQNNFLTIILPTELPMDGLGQPRVPYANTPQVNPAEKRKMIQLLGIDLDRYPKIESVEIAFGIYGDGPDKSSGYASEAEFYPTDPRQASHAIVNIFYDDVKSPYPMEEVHNLGAERRHTSWATVPDYLTDDIWIIPLESSNHPNLQEMRQHLGEQWDSQAAANQLAVEEYLATAAYYRGQFKALRPECEALGWRMCFENYTVFVDISCTTPREQKYTLPFQYQAEDLNSFKALLNAAQKGQLVNVAAPEDQEDTLECQFEDGEVYIGFSIPMTVCTLPNTTS